ncbi:MAG: hypothetical protein AABZ74_12715 [Cyanobacteriota bacterium]
MSEDKDLSVQSYEKKIVNTLRAEKYPIEIINKNSDFLNSFQGVTDEISWAAKFYKEKINKLAEAYAKDFEALVLPSVFEKGMGFEPPEEMINTLKSRYEKKISGFIEFLQISTKIRTENFYHQPTISTGWTVCFNKVDHIPFLLSLGSSKIIIFDPTFTTDLHFFVSLGAMPDIRPLTQVGNIQMPPETYLINLQVMIGAGFKQASVIVMKQRAEDIQNIKTFMNNIVMIVDTKFENEDDFSGLKWVKNSFQYGLFKKKDFLDIAKSLQIGGVIIDKSVSPMQVQKIQSLIKSNVNLNIGFELFKMGTMQYSFIQKKENVNIVYDAFESLICKMPDFVSNMSNRIQTY